MGKRIASFSVKVEDIGDDVLQALVYTEDGKYVGGIAFLEYLINEAGIIPGVAQPDDNTCSIGFCRKELMWYGWSHRARMGFSVGDTAQEGDCCTESGFIEDCEDYKNDKLPVPVGFTAKTLDDAKRMAIAFASSVR